MRNYSENLQTSDTISVTLAYSLHFLLEMQSCGNFLLDFQVSSSFFFFFFCKIEVPLRLTLKILSGLFYFDSGCQCGGSLLALSPGLLTAPYVPAVE